MTNEEMREWRARMNLTQRDAAKCLGITLPTYQAMERGARFSDGAPIIIDKRTALACAAILAGVVPYGSNEKPTEKSRPARTRASKNIGDYRA